MVATRQETIYPIHMQVNRLSQAMAVTVIPENNLTLWHRWTGHMLVKILKDLARREDSGIKLRGDEEDEFCEACVKGKAKRFPFLRRHKH